jgi:outer membrane protein assembly factor BamB/Icc-related predicted phosphoesterase
MKIKPFSALATILLCLLFTLQSNAQEKEPFSFALLSDTHVNENSTDPSEDLMQAIRDINGMPDIEFVVITGDITEFGSDAELIKADSILQQLNKPWYVIPGNHDTNWSESGTNSFAKILGKERFAFSSHGILFVGCGSGPNMRMAPGLVPQEDIVWLRSVLEKAEQNQPVIFFNHYPINESLANWYLVIEALKAVNTQAIFHGHGHRNKAFNFGGIPATMGRSTLSREKENSGYNIVTVGRDSIKVAERISGQNIKAPWRFIPLKDHNFTADTTAIARPSYAVNDQYPNVKSRWEVQDSSDTGTGITVAGDLALYANTAGYLVARNLYDGSQAWKFKTGGKIYSSPAIKGEQAVVASTDSIIYSIDIRDGSLRWRTKTGKSIVASPAIDGNTVYIGSSEGIFRALSLDDGSEKWTNKQIRGFVVTPPLVDEEHVYFGSWGNRFYALNKQTGDTVWTWSGGDRSRMYSPAAVHPVKADSKIFIVAPDRYTTALDAANGEVIWRSDKHKGRESIGLSEDKTEVYVKAMNDSLFAFSASADSMKLQWALDADFGYEISPSPITEKKGAIYIPTDDGRIIAVDSKKKQVRWIHKISNALVNYVYPMDDGDVLTTTMDGKVVRLGYED